MSGSESLADVALRPWPPAKKEELSPEDLLLQIQQLGHERGHLRNVTEKSLQEHVLAGKEAAEEIVEALAQKQQKEDEDRKKTDAPSREARLQEVLRMQHEMSQHMEWAKFAASNTVDLISLVLSADPNKRSLANFSHTIRTQGLDQGLPFGSFGASKEDHTQHVRPPHERAILAEYAQRQELVAKGARMDALDRATDDILKAARKLEKEVRRETKYWQEIVSISDKGWPIQRLRQNMRNVPFAVRYGLPEASSHFKARGLAPLRMDKDGSIVLDPALTLKPKVLRVRISENGQITGTSRLPAESGTDSATIEHTIQRARDSLFEEELYHEMSLETRQLLAYGVEYRDSVIYVQASGMNRQRDTTQLLIDCVPLDYRGDADMKHQNDWIAQNVAEGLRVLLVHEHDMRLYRRTQAPPPLTGQKRAKPAPRLLRTLLAVLHHFDGVNVLHGYLRNVSESLRSAGFPVELETTRETTLAHLAHGLQTSPKLGLSVTDRLLESFSKPLEGKVTFALVSPNGAPSDVISISTHTMIGQPTFGTEHRLRLPSTLATDLDLFPQQKFSRVEEVTSYLDWILSLHIAHRQLKGHFPSRAVTKDHDARVTIRSKDAKNASSIDMDVLIEMQQGKLRIAATTIVPAETTEDREQAYVWDGTKSDMTLSEKIQSWVEDQQHQ
ncbi:RNA polymerase II mediator complex subunit [Pleosporales sp. CAS-2024a]